MLHVLNFVFKSLDWPDQILGIDISRLSVGDLLKLLGIYIALVFCVSVVLQKLNLWLEEGVEGDVAVVLADFEVFQEDGFSFQWFVQLNIPP